jgi:mobilome CxxCx(11)CxxC protein
MANWLTFSGIAVPVIGGGIVFAVYANEKPPEWLFDVTGLLATAQVLVTVFSLVAGWDRKRAISEVARNDFTRLRIALDNLRLDGNGIYDQEVLGRLVTQSYRGSSVDDELEVSEQEKQTAERRALERYPVR